MAAAKFGRSTKLWKQKTEEKRKHVKTKEQEEQATSYSGYFL
jgi:hypothetical protein